MSALPHPLEMPATGHAAQAAHAAAAAVAAPAVEITRPAWLDGAARCARIAALCCLVLLVPGEADRLGSGDLHR